MDLAAYYIYVVRRSSEAKALEYNSSFGVRHVKNAESRMNPKKKKKKKKKNSQPLLSLRLEILWEIPLLAMSLAVVFATPTSTIWVDHGICACCCEQIILPWFLKPGPVKLPCGMERSSTFSHNLPLGPSRLPSMRI